MFEVAGLGLGLSIGLGLLLAIVFAEYANIKQKTEKAFTWIGAGAVSFVLGTVFAALEPTLWSEIGEGGIEAGTYGLWLFQVIGLILVTIGAIWAIVELLKDNI